MERDEREHRVPFLVVAEHCEEDGGFGFDQSKKYTEVENIEEVCVQCQAGQHKKCLKKSKEQEVCECEHCMIYG